MKKIQRKIIFGAGIIGCALAALAGTAIIERRAAPDVMSASVNSVGQELPVIILDAGHGECS